MERGAWQATVHGVAKSCTRLSDLALRTLLPYFYSKSYEHSQNPIHSDTKWRSRPIEQKLAQVHWKTEISFNSLFPVPFKIAQCFKFFVKYPLLTFLCYRTSPTLRAISLDCTGKRLCVCRVWSSQRRKYVCLGFFCRRQPATQAHSL